MPQKSFEEQLKDKAQEFSPIPRAGMWEGIEAQLQPEKKKKRAVFWLSASMAFILISCGLIYSYIYQANHEQGSIAKQDQALVPPAGESSSRVIQMTKTPSADAQPQSQDQVNNGAEIPPSKEKLVLSNNKVATNAHDHLLSSHKNTSGKELPAAQMTRVEEPSNYVVQQEIPENNSQSIHDVETVKEEQVEEQNVLPSIGRKDSIPLIVNLQVNKDTVKKVKQADMAIKPNLTRKYIELVTMPILSGSWLNIDKSYRDSVTYKSQLEDRKSNDKKTWNFGVGLQCGIEKGRYHVFAGLYYQSFAYKMSVRNINSVILRGAVINFDFDFNATDSFAASGKTAGLSPNNPNPPERGESYVTNKFEYLAIPLGMTYMLKHTGKLRLGLSGSIAPQFLLSYKGLLYQQESGFYVKQKSAAENHISKINLSAAAGVEMSYMISGSSSVLLRPQFGITMFPAENARINTRLGFWTFALGYRKYF
jgi:hypothetical protein